MSAEYSFRLGDAWVGVGDSRQAQKVEHDLIELLVVAECVRYCQEPTPWSKSRPG